MQHGYAAGYLSVMNNTGWDGYSNSALIKLRDSPFLTQPMIRGEQVDDRWAFPGSLDLLWNLTATGPVPHRLIDSTQFLTSKTHWSG